MTVLVVLSARPRRLPDAIQGSVCGGIAGHSFRNGDHRASYGIRSNSPPGSPPIPLIFSVPWAGGRGRVVDRVSAGGVGRQRIVDGTGGGILTGRVGRRRIAGARLI